MDPIKYYHQQFASDLRYLNTADPFKYGRGISHLTLSPELMLGEPQAPCELQEFKSIEHKHLFLMCYFFSAVLDQAIHFSLREEHLYFDLHARFPKFVGILVTAHNNLHPNLLLLFATVYIQYYKVSNANQDFKILSEYMIPGFCKFFYVDYSSWSWRRQSQLERVTAIKTLLTTIRDGIEWVPRPRTLDSISYQADLEMLQNWIHLLRGQLDKQIKMPMPQITNESDSSSSQIPLPFQLVCY